MAQSTVEGSGAFGIGPNHSFGQSQAKSGSFALPATSGFVAADAVATAANYRDSSAHVDITSFGDGHFGSAAVTSESYGSTSPMSSHVDLSYRDVLVNSTGVVQQASFALNIQSLAFAFDYGTRVGTNRVGFSAAVYLEGSSAPVWSSSFLYDNGLPSYSASGPGTLTLSGTDIGLAAALPSSCPVTYTTGPQQCAFYSGGFGITDYQTTVALGSVGAGQSVGIRYEVDLTTETDMYGGSASVVFNDPARLTSFGPAAGHLAFEHGDAIDGPGVAAVPEPETYLMMAAGLGLLATARQRRRGR